MKLFTCDHCGQLVFFENDHCEQCGYLLGFDPGTLTMKTLLQEERGQLQMFSQPDGPLYRYCANHSYDVCNWLIADQDTATYCTACQLNQTIPNVNRQEYRQRWQVVEMAKHRLIYALLRLQLLVISKAVDTQNGLSFDFLADDKTGSQQRVLTGHANGLITLNIAEADDVEREMARKAMNEPYRTVLGHFRHEVGHYYWDRLIADSNNLQAFRQLFGDDRLDYGEAVKRHYEEGAPPNWNDTYISAYATTHPWEDWAETWAHYLHIMANLETAYAFGVSVHPVDRLDNHLINTDIRIDPYTIENFDTLLEMWLPLTLALNSLNRSMGQKDIYPFVIPPKVVEKLHFIHKVCLEVRKK